MKEYLLFSEVNKCIEAKNSGHFMHLTEPNLIKEGIEWIEDNFEKGN